MIIISGCILTSGNSREIFLATHMVVLSVAVPFTTASLQPLIVKFAIFHIEHLDLLTPFVSYERMRRKVYDCLRDAEKFRV